MSCRDWEERIALHAGGDLALEESAAVERHLAECPQCRETAAAYGWGLDLLRETHREPIPEAHFAAVRARVLAELGSEHRSVWRQPWAWVLAAAAVVVLAVMAIALGRQPAPRIAAVRPAAPAAAPIFAEPPASPATVARVARVRSIRRKPAVARQSESGQPDEPLLIKLYTDDPDVIIYWIADRKGE
jgi:anti-sigma factor RsiW